MQVFWLQTHPFPVPPCSILSTLGPYPSLWRWHICIQPLPAAVPLKAPYSGWILRIPHWKRGAWLPVDAKGLILLDTRTVQGFCSTEQGLVYVPSVVESWRVAPCRRFKSQPCLLPLTHSKLPQFTFPIYMSGKAKANTLWGHHKN